MKKFIILLALTACTRPKVACKGYKAVAKKASASIAQVLECSNKQAIYSDIINYTDCNENKQLVGFICDTIAYNATKYFQKKIPSNWGCTAKAMSKKLYSAVQKTCTDK